MKYNDPVKKFSFTDYKGKGWMDSPDDCLAESDY